MDADGNEISIWSADAQKKKGQGNDEDSEEDSEESSEESEEDGPSGGAVSREARKQEKKARKEAAVAKAKGQSVQVGDLPTDESDSDDDMPANPNHSKAARSQTKAQASVEAATDGVQKLSVGTPSRKERESMQAQQAKEHYRKLHEQ